MKKALKISALIFGGGIIFTLILFLIKPQFWLKVINPIDFQIQTVDTRINDKEIQLDFDVLLTNNYFLNYIMDSLAYQIYFDTTQFSQGSAVVDNQFTKGQTDTFNLPLTIDRTALKQKMGNLEAGDSTTLKIVFNNYIDLPLTGKTKFKRVINKTINAPQFPEIEVLNVEKDYMSLHDAQFTIYFAITNPNAYEIAIKSIEADILFDDLFNGKANTQERLVVAPKTTTEFTAVVDIDKLELIRDGLRVVFRPNKEWAYQIKATLFIEQKDGSIMEVNIEHEREMNLMERRKEQNKEE